MDHEDYYAHAVNYSVASIKALYLMNAGALVAMLAFFGTALQYAKTLIPIMAPWSIPFVVGLIFAVLANVMGYTSHAAYTRSDNRQYISHQYCGFIAGILSLVAFIIGAMGNIFKFSCYANFH